jgi:hypothetical protein
MRPPAMSKESPDPNPVVALEIRSANAERRSSNSLERPPSKIMSPPTRTRAPAARARSGFVSDFVLRISGFLRAAVPRTPLGQASLSGDDLTLAEVTRLASDPPAPIANTPERWLTVK